MIKHPQPSPEAIFNIGAVTRMTGIPITTLHAWERRYGFPHSSARTLGGHRLYSEKDVTLLRCVKAQIDQGITARQAVMQCIKWTWKATCRAESHRNTPAAVRRFPLPGRARPAGRGVVPSMI